MCTLQMKKILNHSFKIDYLECYFIELKIGRIYVTKFNMICILCMHMDVNNLQIKEKRK